MSLYTGSGDDGTTGLFGGERVGKDHPRIEACGTLDELNACLGLAVAGLASGSPDPETAEILGRLQNLLFDLGADLATPTGSRHESRIRRIGAEDVRQAEAWIDEIDAGNKPLDRFVLPGGAELAARLHLARAVCRRAERRVVNLCRIETVSDEARRFLNRVSDLLFALARRANRLAGVPDVPWEKRA